MKTLLLATAYIPPVQYFSKLNTYENAFIEQYENYSKQSFRNRCQIMTANGIETLVIPIQKHNKEKFLTKDAEIDYRTPWQKLHFKSIESAYGKSPFYKDYIEDLMFIFQKKEQFLLDLNLNITLKFMELFNISCSIQYTHDYISIPTPDINDLRQTIHPKPSRRSQEDNDFIPKQYIQTFSDRFPFAPNLSAIDLLFNEGPESIEYL